MKSIPQPQLVKYLISSDGETCFYVPTIFDAKFCSFMSVYHSVFLRTNRLFPLPSKPARTAPPTASERSSFKKPVRHQSVCFCMLFQLHSGSADLSLISSNDASVRPPSHCQTDRRDHREPSVDHYGALHTWRGTPKAVVLLKNQDIIYIDARFTIFYL